MRERDKIKKSESQTLSATLETLLEKFEILEGKINRLLPDIPPAQPENLILPESALIEVTWDEALWVGHMLHWDGYSEVYDEDELTKFLGFNPNGKDPDGKAWCAGFFIKVLQQCGIDTTGLDLSAKSFINWGYEIEMQNGAFLVFQPKEGAKYPVSHVGVMIDDNKLFGGNQGDSAKRSNLQWYLDNAELVASRCPNGYKLVA